MLERVVKSADLGIESCDWKSRKSSVLLKNLNTMHMTKMQYLKKTYLLHMFQSNHICEKYIFRQMSVEGPISGVLPRASNSFSELNNLYFAEHHCTELSIIQLKQRFDARCWIDGPKILAAGMWWALRMDV